MKAVRPHTIKGILICKLLDLFLFPLHLIKGRKWLRPREFEENPRTMKPKDLIYFAYKYYFRSSVLPPAGNELQLLLSKVCKPDMVDKPIMTISLGGDLMPYAMITDEHCAQLWDEVGSDFFGSDVVFANLETPLHPGRKPMFVPEVMLYDMHFNTNAHTFDVFSGSGKYKGYDVLSVANNHTMDQGEEGIDETLRFLRSRGIQTTGAKAGPEEPDFVITERNGIKTAFIAVTYSLNQFEMPEDKRWKVNHFRLNVPGIDLSPIRTMVAAAREAGADLVILALHAGNAYQAYPSDCTTGLFRRLFEECGPDVIAGAHPHNVQPWFSYAFTDPFSGKQKKGFAIFSFGDFIAYDIYTWCHLCAYVKLKIGRDINGELIMEPLVYPLIMERPNGMLRLVYADKVFSSRKLSREEQDMKILYDICLGFPKQIS